MYTYLLSYYIWYSTIHIQLEVSFESFAKRISLLRAQSQAPMSSPCQWSEMMASNHLKWWNNYDTLDETLAWWNYVDQFECFIMVSECFSEKVSRHLFSLCLYLPYGFPREKSKEAVTSNVLSRWNCFNQHPSLRRSSLGFSGFLVLETVDGEARGAPIDELRSSRFRKRRESHAITLWRSVKSKVSRVIGVSPVIIHFERWDF